MGELELEELKLIVVPLEDVKEEEEEEAHETAD